MNMNDPRKETWEAGNYSTAADQSILPSELLCEAIDLRAGEGVLDVACGTGVTSLAAARRQAKVTGIDFSANSLAIARQRVSFEELPITFQEANAEALPFEDSSFDVVLSSFGAQFVGDQQAAASELIRVCRPGGRIGLTNWTPGPYFGHFFKLMADYAPKKMQKSPTPDKPGVLWGTEERLRELFGDRVEYQQLIERVSRTRSRSVDDWVNGITGNLGPAITILQQINEESQREFIADLYDLATRNNTVPGPDLLLESRYLEVVLIRR
jgi:ubiquinone/menaquinone biosynthesis C-methylase UbiE